MNSITYKMTRISVVYLGMMNNASTNRQRKGSHHSVNKAPGFVNFLGVGRPPPASLGDSREDDFHPGELPVEISQVPLDPCEELETLDAPEIISATVDHQDIWHSSSSEALLEEGEEVSPNHAAPAKPPDLGVQTKVGPKGLPRSFFPTTNVAVPNNVDYGSC